MKLDTSRNNSEMEFRDGMRIVMIEGKWKIDRSYKNICIEMMTENLASLRAKADITQGEISNLIPSSISRSSESVIGGIIVALIGAGLAFWGAKINEKSSSEFG